MKYYLNKDEEDGYLKFVLKDAYPYQVNNLLDAIQKSLANEMLNDKIICSKNIDNIKLDKDADGTIVVEYNGYRRPLKGIIV